VGSRIDSGRAQLDEQETKNPQRDGTLYFVHT
jgi:hypothetical protein